MDRLINEIDVCSGTVQDGYFFYCIDDKYLTNRIKKINKPCLV